MKHTSFRRICKLDTMIRTGQLHSARQGADELEVSVRTLERDIEELRYDLGAELVYDRAKQCYHYEGDPVTLPAQWMNERELAILLIAERALRVFTGTSFKKEVHPAFNKLLDPVRHDRKMMARIREVCKRVMFFNPFGNTPDVSGQFAILFEAILQNKIVSMEYREVADVRVPRQKLEPYFLQGNCNQWFVMGFCRKTRTIKSFVLNMIHRPRIEDQFFAMPDTIETCNSR